MSSKKVEFPSVDEYLELVKTLSANDITDENMKDLNDCITNITSFQEQLKSYADDLEQVRKKLLTLKVEKLQKAEQIKQLSDEWFSMRNEMFTGSSDVCDLLGMSEYGGNVEKVILKKCGLAPKFKGNTFTFHGQKYEDIAKGIYETRHNRHVIEFGLKRHNTLSYLGASPDGITTDGTMIEIKVPYCRKITGKPKIGYFVQMQVQMEVFDLGECDFFECEIEEYECKKDYENDKFENDIYFLNILPKTTDLDHVKVPADRRTEFGLEKGMIGRVGKESTGYDNEYFYPPQEFTSAEQYAWLKEKRKQLRKEGKRMVIDYWRLMFSSLCNVQRDREWWEKNNVNEVLKNSWEMVLERRKQI